MENLAKFKHTEDEIKCGMNYQLVYQIFVDKIKCFQWFKDYTWS